MDSEVHRSHNLPRNRIKCLARYQCFTPLLNWRWSPFWCYVESRRCLPVFIWVPPYRCTGASQNSAPKQKYQTDKKLRRRLIQCTTKYILRDQSLLFCHVHCCGSHQKTIQLINTKPRLGKLTLEILLPESRKGTERCNRSTNLTLDKTLYSSSIFNI